MKRIPAVELPASAFFLKAAVPTDTLGWELTAGWAMVVADGTDQELLMEGVCTPLEYAQVLTAAALEGRTVTKINVPAALADQLRLPERRDWFWLRRDRPFPVTALPPDCQIVQPGVADQEIDRFLKLHDFDFHVAPGNPEIQFWAVGRDQTRDLAAVAAGLEWTSGERVINSVAVRPDLRRQGLGSAITLLAAGEHFRQGADGVALGVRGSNLGALKLYQQLGFDRQAMFAGARLSPRPTAE